MHVKKGDNIIVLAGKDKGKTGKILKALPREDKVLVEGMNLKKVHNKKGNGTKGSIVEKSFPIHVSNVRLADKKPSAKKVKKSVAKEA